jgi:hypothetical protein
VWRIEVRLAKGILFALFIWTLPVIAAIAGLGFTGCWDKKPCAEKK